MLLQDPAVESVATLGKAGPEAVKPENARGRGWNVTLDVENVASGLKLT